MSLLNYGFVLFCFFTLGLSIPSLNAQHDTTVNQDYQWVKLNDGSRLKVQSFKTNPEGTVYELLMINGSTLTIKNDEIKKIKMPNHQWVYNKNAHVIPEKGKYSSFTTGVLMNRDEGGDFKISLNGLQFSQGLYLNKRWSVGMGAAIDIYTNAQLILPIFLEGKYFVAPTKNIAPYIGMRAGMGPSPNWRARGGPMIHPHIGLRGATRSNTQVNFEFGIRIQQQNEQFGETVRVTTFRRYSMGIGIYF